VVEGSYDPKTGASLKKDEFNATNFMGELVREVIQIQSQAQGKQTFAELPLFEGGLVPSSDGFHWRETASARSSGS
jgi:hypothetical protein